MRERSLSGMLPAQVADIVYTAVQDEQFYILTDTDWDERILSRHDDIMHRR
jgi:hypothetical protein